MTEEKAEETTVAPTADVSNSSEATSDKSKQPETESTSGTPGKRALKIYSVREISCFELFNWICSTVLAV